MDHSDLRAPTLTHPIVPGAVGVTMRLLYPLHVPDRSAALATLTKVGGARIWKPERPHDKYFEEVLPPTRQLLFGVDRGGAFDGYLRVDRALVQRWFGNTTAVVLNGDLARLSKKRGLSVGAPPVALPIHLDAEPGIELFVPPCGVGVLSFCFTLRSRDLPTGLTDDVIQDAFYHLSHLKYRVPVFRKPHPQSDPSLVKVHPDIPAPPASGAPLAQRLGHAGGEFTLVELVDLLLDRSESPDLFVPVQDQFLVYGVTRFSIGVRFDEATACSSLMARALSLAQLEERHHSPPVIQEPSIPVATLNTHHLVATSVLGSCHFVADQQPLVDGHPQGYDAQRVHTVVVKYFLPYLVALVQRTKLAQFRIDAATLVAMKESTGVASDRAPEPPTTSSRALHLAVSNFAASSDLHEVSRRDAVNRFFASVQQALRIDVTLAGLHRILRDIASADRSELDTMQLVKLVDTQHRVEFIEMFIVSFYAFEMAEVLGHNLGFSSMYLAVTTVLAGALGAASVYLLGIRNRDQLVGKRTWFGVIILLIGLWIVVGRITAKPPLAALATPPQPSEVQTGAQVQEPLGATPNESPSVNKEGRSH